MGNIADRVRDMQTSFDLVSEDIIIDMLGRWVSELEPVVVYPKIWAGTPYPIGLTAKGHDRIYVHARP